MDVWLVIGLVAQLIFASRFVVQWLASEKRKRSHIPVAFWYLSIVGSLSLLAYAIHRRDIVFTLGQGASCFIYFRNLHLIYLRRLEKQKCLVESLAQNRRLIRRMEIWAFVVIIFIVTPLTIITLNRMMTRKVGSIPIEGLEELYKRFDIDYSGVDIVDYQDDTVSFRAYQTNPVIKMKTKSDASDSIRVLLGNVMERSITVDADEQVMFERKAHSNGVGFCFNLPPGASVTIRNFQPSEFSFIVWTGFKYVYNYLDVALSEIKKRNPSFLILNTGFLEKVRDIDYKIFKSKMDSLDVPVYFVAGWNEYRKVLHNDFYEREFGHRYYYFIFKDALFIVLDDGQKFLSKEQLDFLEEILRETSSYPLKKKFLFMYYWPLGREEFEREKDLDPKSLPGIIAKSHITDVFFVAGVPDGFISQQGTHFRRTSGDTEIISNMLRQSYLEVSYIDGKFSFRQHTFSPGKAKPKAVNRVVLLVERFLFLAKINLAGFILILATTILWIAIFVMLVIRLFNRKVNEGKSTKS